MKPILTLCCALIFTGCSLFTASQYDTQDLQFRSQGLTFTGTLYTPKTAPPYPLVVIAHGSGDSKRSFSAYTYYGKYLSRNGFAVFIFDKRGVGDSEGIYTDGEIHFDSLGLDLSAAFRFASHLPVTSPERSGILGISQAGWTIPLALQSIDTIGFVVNVSGPSVPPYYSDMYYRTNELRDDGYTEDELTEISAYNRAVARYVGTFDDRNPPLELKRKFRDRPWFKKLGYNPNLSPEDTLRQPQYDHYRRGAFDPAPFWNRPSLPVLCLFGDKDSHIPVDTIARRFEQIFSSKQFSDYTIKRFPSGGHILQQVDAPMEKVGHDPISMLLKGFPEPTEEAMQFTVQWIKARTVKN
jgi:pimeloyl-ACP methyl ester carboxylesterase